MYSSISPSTPSALRNLRRYAHSDVEEEKSSAQWAQVLNGLNFEQI
jgi:hypothetical protein